MHTILLVDNEPKVLKLLGATLSRSGYSVFPHRDALPALSALRHGTQVDLVITDLHLPGMNGTEFIDALTQAAPSTPIIVLTGSGDVETYVTCLSRGVFDYIHKPIKMRELERIVNAALEGSRSGKYPSPQNAAPPHFTFRGNRS